MTQALLDYLQPSFRPQLRSDAVIRRIGDEGLVWGDAVHPLYLDPAAALLVSVVDGVATGAEIAEDVADAIEIEIELATAHVARTLNLLAAAGALVDIRAAHNATVLDRQWLPEPNW